MVPSYSLGTCPPTNPKTLWCPIAPSSRKNWFSEGIFFWQITRTALESPKIYICQNWPRRVLGDVIRCLESKFDKKIPMRSVPNCRKEIPARHAIRWFKCKLKPPKNVLMTHSATFLSGMLSDMLNSSSSSNILGDGCFALGFGTLFGLASFFSCCLFPLLFSFSLSASASLSSLPSSRIKEVGFAVGSAEFPNISVVVGSSSKNVSNTWLPQTLHSSVVYCIDILHNFCLLCAKILSCAQWNLNIQRILIGRKWKVSSCLPETTGDSVVWGMLSSLSSVGSSCCSTFNELFCRVDRPKIIFSFTCIIII